MTDRSTLWKIAAAVATVAAIALSLFVPQGLAGWLCAAIFWSSLPIGGLFLALTMQMVPGRWQTELSGSVQPALLLFPLALLTFVPVAFGLPGLYPWAADAGSGMHHSFYFSSGFFILRTFCYLALLAIVSAISLRKPRWSSVAAVLGLILLSLGGMVIYADWLMSLDAQFHSSEFGLYFLSIQATVALAFFTLMRLGGALPDATGFKLLGALLLCALLLWIYLAFMQFVIIWSTNLPENAGWYLRRQDGMWGLIAMAIIILHVIPAFLLFFDPVRRSRGWVASVCWVVLVAKGLEIMWIVLPGRGAWAGVSTIVSLAGVGLLYLAIMHGIEAAIDGDAASGGEGTS